jgi:hypothetical protein
MKLQILLCAMLSVASASSIAAANGRDPATKPGLSAAGASASAASQSSPGPFYEEFGEFVYRLLTLQRADHTDPVDVNNLSVELIYDDATEWFDLVL